eukprot:g3587.t1
MFWYTFLSFAVGASLASVVLSGAQRLAMISAVPCAIACTFTDAMPRHFVKSAWTGFFFSTLLPIFTIIALKDKAHDPKLDFHLPLFGTYNWTGMVVSSLSNFIVMMIKIFVTSYRNPKNFAILKVALQSTKMMENRAKMILATAEKEKLYNKIGEDGQKLITAVVGSTSDVPWEFTEKKLKGLIFTRQRMDEKHHITSETEFKVEMYFKGTLEQAYRDGLHVFPDYKVMYEEISNKANVRPALPSMRILYRRVKVPYPALSDRLLCIKSQYRYYPEHGFAFVVTQDAELKYVDQIPKNVMEGTVRTKKEAVPKFKFKCKYDVFIKWPKEQYAASQPLPSLEKRRKHYRRPYSAVRLKELSRPKRDIFQSESEKLHKSNLENLRQLARKNFTSTRLQNRREARQRGEPHSFDQRDFSNYLEEEDSFVGKSKRRARPHSTTGVGSRSWRDQSPIVDQPRLLQKSESSSAFLDTRKFYRSHRNNNFLSTEKKVRSRIASSRLRRKQKLKPLDLNYNSTGEPSQASETKNELERFDKLIEENKERWKLYQDKPKITSASAKSFALARQFSQKVTPTYKGNARTLMNAAKLAQTM